ncbi:cell envelope-related transcriptional attenuator [Catenulispora acidiphila DSM 44928]|uniref:Cell envelope-related transcriptional attenuator n=1 Tax=Catenulispora acidiphila (strain DSM 44928 / JCM 14897 / NBRC 102108 / NRRL B-24433 / ID139908) TaxID=479433 RepID=C7QCH9_CATAD|nr:LCP family protein [Catenulispora acidiphila]ACU76442.1 cell envelope-related transcriptional attenuator [Catenulispora acidiphila DSM 44928]
MAGERNEPLPWERAGRQPGGGDGRNAGRQSPQPSGGYGESYDGYEDGYADPPARAPRRAARGPVPPARAEQGHSDDTPGPPRGRGAYRYDPDSATEGEMDSGGRSGRGGRTGRGAAIPAAGGARKLAPRGVITISAASLAITVIGAGAFTYEHFNGSINTFNDSGLATNRPAEAKANAAGQRPENILLVGSDSRDNGNNAFGGGKTGDGARSDTSILLHVYADHQHAVGISIPRDMMVKIPTCQLDPNNSAKGHTSPQTNQFNAAFAVGNTAQGNVACEINTIESISGIRIDHTVVVGFSAFAKLTDDIGGVQVCVPKDVSDVGGDNITLKKGIQTVKGQTALDYVREREGLGDGSDIGRTRRQQAFLGSMIKKVESDGVLNNPTVLSSIFNDALKDAQFDPGLGSLTALSGFAESMKGINPANIQFLTLPGHYRTQDGRVDMDPVAAGVIWTHLKSDTLLDGSGSSGASGAPSTPAAPTTTAATSSAPPAPSISPSTISVLVKNGTTVTGLAADVTTSLQAQGYNAETSHVTPPHTAVTTIVYGTSKQKAAAEQLATLYPGAKVAAGTYSTQIVVTLGDDYAAAHPKGGGAGTTSGAPASGSTGASSSGTSGTLPTDIANNSRTADQDICSGITAGYGAGTG